MLKYCVNLCIEQLYYQRIFLESLQGSQQFFFLKIIKLFLWPPLDEILENYTEILVKTIYITGILSTHIFKIIVGKPVEENIKKINYFFKAPLE